MHVWVVERLWFQGWCFYACFDNRQDARDFLKDEVGRSKTLRAMFRVRKYVRVEQ